MSTHINKRSGEENKNNEYAGSTIFEVCLFMFCHREMSQFEILDSESTRIAVNQ